MSLIIPPFISYILILFVLLLLLLLFVLMCLFRLPFISLRRWVSLFFFSSSQFSLFVFYRENRVGWYPISFHTYFYLFFSIFHVFFVFFDWLIDWLLIWIVEVLREMDTCNSIRFLSELLLHMRGILSSWW